MFFLRGFKLFWFAWYLFSFGFHSFNINFTFKCSYLWILFLPPLFLRKFSQFAKSSCQIAYLYFELCPVHTVHFNLFSALFFIETISLRTCFYTSFMWIILQIINPLQFTMILMSAFLSFLISGTPSLLGSWPT